MGAGWAAWLGGLAAGPSTGAATLTLRNPRGTAAAISLDADDLFELPWFAPAAHEMRSPYETQRVRRVLLTAGAGGFELAMAPCEALAFEGSAAIQRGDI